MSVYAEVARILAEEVPKGAAQVRLDLSKCTLMDFDHWAPEELHGQDPDAVIAALDHHDVMVQVAAANETADVA